MREFRSLKCWYQRLVKLTQKLEQQYEIHRQPVTAVEDEKNDKNAGSHNLWPPNSINTGLKFSMLNLRITSLNWANKTKKCG